MKKPAATLDHAPRDGRRLAFALAASLLVHAGAAAFIAVLPIGGGREESPVAEDRAEPLLWPVQIAFVPMSPRNSIPTPAMPATLAPPKPDREMAKAEPTPAPEPVPPPEPQPPTPPEPAAVTPAVKPQAVERAPEPPAPAPPSPAPKQERPAAIPAAPAIASATRRPSLDPGKTAASSSPAAPAAPPGSPPREAPGDGRPGDANRTRKGSPGRPAGPARAAASPAAATAAEILDLPTPEYPPRSRRQGEQGLVLLEVEVLPDGRAGQVRVLLAPDYPRLVEAAVEATRKATFRPALLDGRPVRSVIEIPFRFRLE